MRRNCRKGFRMKTIKDMKEKEIFIAGYKAMFVSVITSPWDEEYAERAYEIFTKKRDGSDDEKLSSNDGFV